MLLQFFLERGKPLPHIVRPLALRVDAQIMLPVIYCLRIEKYPFASERAIEQRYRIVGGFGECFAESFDGVSVVDCTVSAFGTLKVGRCQVR